MLRISVHEDTEPMAVLLEGKLSGDWVRELRGEWTRLRSLRRDRIMVVILTGVSFVDAEGRRLLAEIYSAGCVLTGSGLFARDLIEKIENIGVRHHEPRIPKTRVRCSWCLTPISSRLYPMRSIVLVLLFVLAAFGQTRTTNTLDIYVVDVEGGNATLMVSPSKESLLIDTGNANAAAVRDVNRIMEAVKDAGLQQIDHLITTHWHGDHFGGLAELASRIPVREFIDHGPNAQPNAATDDFIRNTYPKLYAMAKHTVARPGDKISIRGLDVLVITSAGQVIKTSLRGAGGMNPILREFQAEPRQCRRSTIRRRPCHLWGVPNDSPGRSDKRQGVRADVSQ